MQANSPLDAIHLLDEAFNHGDLAAILDIYDESAVVLTPTGESIRGKAGLHAFYTQVLGSGASAHQLKTHVVEADGVALFLSHWQLLMPGNPPQQFISTVVLRQQADGTWKTLLDNAYGPAVLDLPQAP